MHYFEFGKRDATIYSGGTTSSINTGFDEILEINKVFLFIWLVVVGNKEQENLTTTQ
jgi:hypothetical protein